MCTALAPAGEEAHAAPGCRLSGTCCLARSWKGAVCIKEPKDMNSSPQPGTHKISSNGLPSLPHPPAVRSFSE